MKIEVFNQEKTSEKVLRLRLIQTGSSVILAAVDEHGITLPTGYILIISENGIDMCDYVNPISGLPLDKKGRVKLVD